MTSNYHLKNEIIFNTLLCSFKLHKDIEAIQEIFKLGGCVDLPSKNKIIRFRNPNRGAVLSNELLKAFIIGLPKYFNL